MVVGTEKLFVTGRARLDEAPISCMVDIAAEGIYTFNVSMPLENRPSGTNGGGGS